MYEAFWRLNGKPFEDDGDPRSYYPTEAHQGALLKLRYAIEGRRPAAVLAGPSGTGKTMLVEILKRQLPERYRPFVHLVYPQLLPAELFGYLADELGAPPAGSSQQPLDQVLRRLQSRLVELARQGQHAVLAVDEAHLLSDPRTWAALRLLLNFTVAGNPTLTLLLVGAPLLLSLLERQPELENRVSVKCLLRPLSLEETFSYVSHRLASAGGSGGIFDGGALEALFQQARGVPRLLNRLADLALLVGFAEDRRQLGAGQIETIADELVNVAPE